MTHLPTLVYDLALILITAGVVTILFKWLKQPVVLGYIVAGFLVGPHLNLIPTVVDSANIAVWSEIGIIFLLFALGLEFRLKKLLDVGKPALIAAAIGMGVMVGIGFLTGYLFGWTNIEGLFLGGMISMASTTIIIKAFTDMKVQKERYAGIVFGVLIIEDIAAILMMVLFSTIAVSQTFQGMQLLESLVKLIFFMIIWFVVGIFVIPTLLRRVRKFLNDETLLIVSVGLCLGMVLLAHSVGFSAALGAFIMGSILAESVGAKKIEELVSPLKNLFGAVFFVSVGMMIVPDLIVANIAPILILTGVVLVGRIVFATFGVLVSGESLKVSMQAGFSLAQIGEFSFIIATLGIQLGVISEFIYPIIVAVSVITTFTTPYGIRYSENIYNQVAKIIPKKWNKLLVGKQNEQTKKSDFAQLMEHYFMPILIYVVLCIAINILSEMYLVPFVTLHITTIWGRVLAATLTLSMVAPFLYGILKTRPRASAFYQIFLRKLPRIVVLMFILLPKVVCVFLVLSVLLPIFPLGTTILILISAAIVTIISFNPRFALQSEKMENAFLENLKDEEK
ncbi:sodium:proton antiporter [Bacteroidia bacterium]|nr:sodium:proton antiporter [Bacteroidia bacterium]